MADERDPATSHSDLYHRHGEPDSSQWDKAEAVTDRPNDTPLRGEDKPAVPNTTFGQRAKTNSTKAVDQDSADAENKSVTSAATKTTKAAKKK